LLKLFYPEHQTTKNANGTTRWHFNSIRKKNLTENKKWDQFSEIQNIVAFTYYYITTTTTKNVCLEKMRRSITFLSLIQIYFFNWNKFMHASCATYCDYDTFRIKTFRRCLVSHGYSSFCRFFLIITMCGSVACPKILQLILIYSGVCSLY
jgi:hypothetical protein